MKLRFEIGDWVVFNINKDKEPTFYETCSLVYGSNPMKVIGVDYQHPVLEPINEVQHKFKAAGFWPLLPESAEGIIYTVRWWPDAKAKQYDCDGNYLQPLQEYGESRFHEQWLKPVFNRRKFLIAAKRWRNSTGHLSNLSTIMKHEACREIVAMGIVAVPCCLEQLANEGSLSWCILLHELTGINPAPPPEPVGGGGFVGYDVAATKKAWLQWGTEKGLYYE